MLPLLSLYQKELSTNKKLREKAIALYKVAP